MLYSFTKKEDLTPLDPLEELQVRESNSPEAMATLGKISKVEAMRRFAEDNKAFVAYWNETPAAFGWMAMGKAKVGELNHEIILPQWHRYLWNFRTLPEFQGKGIYPRLLQYILKSQMWNATCLWIMHAPENLASERGILKAGFRFESKVSVLGGEKVILEANEPSKELEKLIAFSGFINSFEEQATCWNCSSPYVKNKKECCCTPRNIRCNSKSLLSV